MRSAREALLAQRSAHQRRLDELLIQRATIGIVTPPQINTEIEDIEAELAKIDSGLAALDSYRELRNATETVGIPDRRDQSLQQHIMIATVQATVAEFASLRKSVYEAQSEMRDELKSFRSVIQWFILGISAVLLVVLGIIIYIDWMR